MLSCETAVFGAGAPCVIKKSVATLLRSAVIIFWCSKVFWDALLRAFVGVDDPMPVEIRVSPCAATLIPCTSGNRRIVSRADKHASGIKGMGLMCLVIHEVRANLVLVLVKVSSARGGCVDGNPLPCVSAQLFGGGFDMIRHLHGHSLQSVGRRGQ